MYIFNDELGVRHKQAVETSFEGSVPVFKWRH
jgi:hypothetical protein